jgi:hypothetical protein
MRRWSHFFDSIRMSGHDIDPGLGAAELARVEERCGCRLPPDLADLLGKGLPSGVGFPDWRRLDHKVDAQLAAPIDGVLFDVEHNAFWHHSWGPRPEAVPDRLVAATRLLEAAPRLIPVFGHRYLPAEPHEAGNPILSVHQTDIIYYGDDLITWGWAEFGGTFPGGPEKPRHVRFWSELI